MRDAEIIRSITELAQLKQAVIDNHLSFAHEMLLMRTRIDALEKALVGGRFSLVCAAVISLFSPQFMARIVQKIHTREIEKFNAEMLKKKKQSLIVPEGGLCVR